jgi:DNA-directed RNA polymerase specialized sigma24 family protein
MSAMWQGGAAVGSAGRQVPSRRDLDAYNQQVLACQDQVFTLALHLLGDEQAADAAVARAVRAVYTRARPRPSVRIQLIAQVLRSCDRRLGHGDTSLPVYLRTLPEPERHALLLVDLLGLCYDEAAEVLGCSRPLLAGRLAAGRQRLVEQSREHQLSAISAR